MSKVREGLEVDAIDGAALLAMHRCGHIATVHARVAMGLSKVRTVARLYDLRSHKLVKRTTPQTRNGGNGYYQWSVTLKGFGELCKILAGTDRDPEDVAAALGKWRDAGNNIWTKALLEHRFGEIDAVISAERSVLPGWRIVRAITEYRRDEFTGERFPTADLLPDDRRLKFDAIVLAEEVAVRDSTRLFAVEIDMGTKSIESAINEKLRKIWDWIPLGRASKRFGADDPVASVVFVTTSRARISNIRKTIKWDLFPRIWLTPDRRDELLPSDVFHFTTHDDMRRDFWGPHYQVPVADGRFALIDQPGVADARAA